MRGDQTQHKTQQRKEVLVFVILFYKLTVKNMFPKENIRVRNYHSLKNKMCLAKLTGSRAWALSILPTGREETIKMHFFMQISIQIDLLLMQNSRSRNS